MYHQALNKKLATYFKSHIVVNLVLTPVPTTAREAEHLYNNFKTLGNLEYFKIRRDKSKLNTYDQRITLIYNPLREVSFLRPLDDTTEIPETSQHELDDSNNSLIDKLNRIIAIPRYSFVEGDEKYWSSNEQVLFKYRMRPDGLRFVDKYNISSSILSDQFCYIQDEVIDPEEVSSFRKTLRHNFQKFHKFDSIKTSLGLAGMKNYLPNIDVTDMESLPNIDYKRLLIDEY